ncbi:CIA30 family protein [Oceanisphaera avium]|uniref:NADH:ubiquinone oxidoreductase intermediate-associated protein 30 domain-containing protein n=1 Tax=Oceanisphaera avium TaxID=1903694 RepID=A0A1Y0CZ64_9GAMM|nr:CIA30 family protein [Oceanisphaera avium]ART80115.1 hypothetical protein CBP12_08115 [Oceanisphaera avium]
MNEKIKTHGPAVPSEQLIDVYNSTQHEPSAWKMISDQVMGGVSSGDLHQTQYQNATATCLTGRTSLDNNGGFVQMKLDIEPSELSADYKGLFIELAGNSHHYNLHVKTTQLTRPWQSFRYTLAVAPHWTRFIVPFEQLLAHRTETEFQQTEINSVAVVAIGEEFEVEICVRRFGFYK